MKNKIFKNIVNIKLVVDKLTGENHSGDESKKKKKDSSPWIENEEACCVDDIAVGRTKHTPSITFLVV